MSSGKIRFCGAGAAKAKNGRGDLLRPTESPDTDQPGANNVSSLSAPRACNNLKVKLAEITEP
jgi:hypothetical protein